MSIGQLPRRVVRTAQRRQRGISYRREPTLRRPISQACTFDQICSSEYAAWCERLRIPALHHRKTWEWVFILRALEYHGMLQPGRRGVGFGVGKEPIASHIVSRGCVVLATDLPANTMRVDEWEATDQHANDLRDVNVGDLCPDDVFLERATFRPVDMRHLPNDLGTFDFSWSSCAMEHLGSLEDGMRFFERQVQFLVPGGVGVHTTEFNVNPHGDTAADGGTVLYQRQHIEQLCDRMRALGHRMRVTFALGNRPEDLHVDKRPFTNTHIRTETYGYPHTSFGLIVERGRHT